MDRPVKERLVGAAVLMAAAIILIPEMLSGPDRAESEPTQRMAGETPLKTYTIDLNRPIGSPRTPERVDVRTPPPEEPVETAVATEAEAVAENQVKPEQAPPDAEIAPSHAPAGGPAGAASDARSVMDLPTPTPQPAFQPPQTLASTPSVPTSGGWAVQLGSFSKQATAERLAMEFRAEGKAAFVMPVRSGAATLYRVRVGPMKDRSSAEAALRALKAKAPGAAVVAHP